MNTCFTLEETADILDPNSETANLRLSTMSARDNVIRCQKLRGLQVRGYDSDMFIDLPITYSRNFIPTERSHIPTPTIAKKWPHLRRTAHLMHPMQDCEVELLIGYNCPLALAPRSYITGEGNQPFAIQTVLGWSIVGGTDPYVDGDAIGTTHKIVVKDIQDQLRPRTEQEAHRQEVRFIAKTTVKEVMDILPTEITRILESDFTYGSKGDKHVAGGYAVLGENWQLHPPTGGWALQHATAIQHTTKPTKQQKRSTAPFQSSQTPFQI